MTTVELDNTFRIYGCKADAASIPALEPLGLVILAFLLVGIAYLGNRRRARA